MDKETRYEQDFDYPELNKMGAEEFYRTYKAFMFSIARNEGLDHGQADLVINDIMITIFMKKACYFDPRKNRFSNYLATMVRNGCRSLRRRERRYIAVEDDDLVRLCEENGAVARDVSCDAGEIRACVEEGIRLLRKEVHSQLMVDAFVMSVLEEERPMDVAKKLNVRPDYVSLAKNRCLPRLRIIVSKLLSR